MIRRLLQYDYNDERSLQLTIRRKNALQIQTNTCLFPNAAGERGQLL